MVVKLSTLRVSAEMDASKYQAGMAMKVAADKQGAASSAQVGAAITATDTKISTASNGVERLARSYITGYAAEAKFEAALRTLGRALDTGNISAERAQQILVGLHSRYGAMASAADLAAAGQHQLAAAVTAANASLAANGNALDMNTAAQMRNNAAQRSASATRQNLLYQYSDVGVSLAGGINPGMVAVQQLPQIISGPGGLNAALAETGNLAGMAVKRFGLIGAAIGIGAAAIESMKDSINETSDVTVSFGDTALAVWQVIAGGITDYIKPVTDKIGEWFGIAWDWVEKATRDVGNFIVREIVGAIEIIKTVVASIGPAFTVAGEVAAEGLANAIIYGIREAQVKFNEFVGAINTLAGRSVMGRMDLIEYADFDFGGAAAVKELEGAWGDLGATLDGIAGRDYMGEFFGAVKDRAIQNATDRLDENAEAAGAAASEAAKLAKAYDDIVAGGHKFIQEQENERTALGQTEEQANALRYTFELLNKAKAAGIDLDALTADGTKTVRQELTGLAGEMAAAEAETDRLTKAFEDQKKVVDDVLGTIGDAFSGLFDGTIKDFDSFLDHMMGGFAKLGQQNFDKLFSSDGLGKLFETTTGADGKETNFFDTLFKATKKGTKEGSAEGSAFGISQMAGYASAAVGGFGMGYEAQDPLMGGLGGAAQGAMAGAAGGPVGMAIGAVVGGIAGFVGGLFGANKALEEAKQKVNENRLAIEQFIAAANGEQISQYAKTLADFNKQALELISLAEKAGDQALVAQLRAANDNVKGTLGKQFADDLEASINRLNDADYLNQVTAAQERYNLRLKDAALLGVDGSRANTELALSLQKIVTEGELSAEVVAGLAAAFPALAGALAGVKAYVDQISSGPTADELFAATVRAQSGVDQARAELRAAYGAEREAIDQVASKLRTFIAGIRTFRESLRLDASLSPLNPYERMVEAQRQFQDLSTKALTGDPKAMERLEDVSRQYLEEARAYYGTSEAYFSIFTQVESLLDQALAQAEGQLSAADQQLVALDAQTGLLGSIDNGVMSVAQAMANLAAALAIKQAADNANAGNGFSAEINKIYRDVVSRAPDAEGAQYWQKRFDAGLPMADIYRQFIADVIRLGGTPNTSTVAQYGIDPVGSRPMPGYAMGGYTGGFENQVAGLVHGREYVFDAQATARIGVGNLDAMRSGAANSNSSAELVRELREMRQQNERLTRELIRVTAAGAQVTASAAGETTDAVRQQTNNNRRERGTRVA